MYGNQGRVDDSGPGRTEANEMLEDTGEATTTGRAYGSCVNLQGMH